MAEVRHTIDELQLRVTLADGALVAGGGTGAVDSVNGQTGAVVLAASDVGAVPTTRTVAGKALSADVTLAKADVGLGSVDNTADAAKAVLSATKLATARAINGIAFDGSTAITVADSTKVPITRTVAGHALSADVTISAADVGAVPTTRTVNGHALSGDVTVAYTDLTGKPTIPTLAWFNVKDSAYGATGDGTTDDTAAINSAIAALNTAGKGTLYFPAGTYKCTAALTTVTAHARICGDGAGDKLGNNAATLLKWDSTTGDLLTLAADGMIVEDIAFENPTTTTQTAGSAIHVTQGDHNKYRNVSVRGFFYGMNLEDGAEWAMNDCFVIGPAKYALYVRHVNLVDGGDMTIKGCHFHADVRAADAAIRYESGGGLKLIGNKVNAVSTQKFTYALDATITGATGVMTVSGNSFENVSGAAIRGQNSGGSFQEVTITGNQFGYYGSGSYSAVDITGWHDVTVVGNTGLASTSSAAMVKFTSVTGGYIGANTPTGFASEYALTTCTGVRTVPAAVADISGAAPLASPTFTGTPAAPTATAGTNTTQIATTAFVTSAVTGAGSYVDPLTTKGDLVTRTASATTRQAVGSDGTVVMADSAQTNGIKYKALDDSDVAPVAPNDQTGTTYTFVLADGRRLVTCSNASAQTYTVPPNSSVAYPLGTVLSIWAKGAGQVTLAPGSGVTLSSAHGLKTSAQYAMVSLTKVLTDTWAVSGDTTA